MNREYKFESSSECEVITICTDAVAWTELAESFYNFLLACGFVLTRQDLSDLFDMGQFDTAVNKVMQDTPVSNHASRYGLGDDDVLYPSDTGE